MNRINKLFNNKKSDILSVYYTAGFPKLDDTVPIARHLQQAGADIIEIGIPFSDPVADGPTIQQSNTAALKNGMTMKLLFQQLAALREQVNVPVVLMGYINPVIQYGLEAFCAQCKTCGVDGLILPDLPLAEYLQSYKPLFDKYGLKSIFLISPQTSDERIRQIDECSDAFIYMVSTAGTTGARDKFDDQQVAYFDRIAAMKLKNPRLIGFGISNKTTFEQAAANSHGAIIGSAFINLLAKSQHHKKDIENFIEELRR